MRRIRTLGAATLAFLLMSAVTSAALAGTIRVAGTQVVIDEQTGSYEMHGSLVGKWNTTAFKENYKSPSSYVGSGKEKFVGCVDSDRSGSCETGEPTGTMTFSFIYWASFNPATKALVRGACVHPVIAAGGDFAAATGVIFMKDTPVGKEVRTTYTGSLTIPSVRTPSSRGLSVHAAATCGH